jgi:hypothetical protein
MSTHRTQYHALEQTASFASSNLLGVAFVIPCLFSHENNKTFDLSQLTPEEMERLCKDDLFMYHSILNKISDRKVCDFGRVEGGETAGDADVAGGGVGSRVQANRIIVPHRNIEGPLGTGVMAKCQWHFSNESIDDYDTIFSN